MKKEFVPYEIALNMKSIGFDEPCFGVYGYNRLDTSIPDQLIDKTVLTYIQDIIENENFILTFDDLKNSNIDDDVSAPLYQQAFRWLYKNLNIEKGIMPLDIESQQLLLKELIDKISLTTVKNEK